MARMMQDYDAKVGIAPEFDILADEGGLLKRRGRVLFHDTFDGGSFNGWRDHFDGNDPRPPVGLTSYPVKNGSHALMLSTGSIAYDVDAASMSNGTFKNLTMYRASGLMSLSGFFALGSGYGTEVTGDTSWANWGIGFDTQRASSDATSRGFMKLTCRSQTSGATPTWTLTSDESPIGTAQPSKQITAAAGNEAGQNENKYNFNYLRLTIDLDQNGGLGGYHEAQINEQVYDLRSLGAGRGAQAPQAGAGAFTDFKRGFNAHTFLTASSTKTTRYPSWLVMDDVMVTVDDERAA